MNGWRVFRALSVPLAMLAGAAQAADLPTKKPAPLPIMAPVAPFTFTGPSVGIQGGFAWDGEELYVPLWLRHSYSIERHGGFGGLVAGYDYQFANPMWGGGGLVAGVQADYNLSNVTGGAAPGGRYITTNKVNNFGSVNLKLGFAYNRFMIYGLAGLGLMSTTHTLDQPLFANAYGSFSNYSAGQAFGLGVEYAFTDNWIGFASFQNYRMPSKWYGAVPVLGAHSATETLDVARFGITYKFGS